MLFDRDYYHYKLKSFSKVVNLEEINLKLYQNISIDFDWLIVYREYITRLATLNNGYKIVIQVDDVSWKLYLFKANKVQIMFLLQNDIYHRHNNRLHSLISELFLLGR